MTKLTNDAFLKTHPRH